MLFQLRKNIIVNNPRNCYKINGDFIGYEIFDGIGNMILKVETKFHKIPELEEEYFFTTIKANFYNKSKKLVFTANSGEPNENILGTTKMMFGLGEICIGYSDEESQFISFILTNGNVYEPVRGTIENTDFVLDGKCLMNAKIDKCTVVISTGDFTTIGGYSITDCTLNLEGAAYNIAFILASNK